MEDARRDAENGCRRSLNLSTRSIWYPGAAVVDICHDDPTRMVRFSRSSIRGNFNIKIIGISSKIIIVDS